MENIKTAEDFLKLDDNIRHEECEHTFNTVISWMEDYASEKCEPLKKRIEELEKAILGVKDFLEEDGYIDLVNKVSNPSTNGK